MSVSQIVATLKRASGEELVKVPLPEFSWQVPLSRYVSFLCEMRKFEMEGINPIQVMAQAVSEFTGVEIDTLLKAKVGEQWTEEKQLDGGIRSLYGWCVNVVSSYKGEARKANNFSFDYWYEGKVGIERFNIPFIVAAELAGGLPVLPEIETAEAIEAFETMRGFRQQIKDAGDPTKERVKRIKQLKEAIVKEGDKNGDMAREMRKLEAEIEIEGDPNGNLMFAQYLRMIAILAKKEGERLPANDGDRERWIQNRMIHLQHIDTKTALDVDFFLIGLLTRSNEMPGAIGSLILPLFALAAANQSRPQQSGKHTKGQFRTKKKFKSGLVGVQSSKPLSKGVGLILPK